MSRHTDSLYPYTNMSASGRSLEPPHWNTDEEEVRRLAGTMLFVRGDAREATIERMLDLILRAPPGARERVRYTVIVGQG